MVAPCWAPTPNCGILHWIGRGSRARVAAFAGLAIFGEASRKKSVATPEGYVVSKASSGLNWTEQRVGGTEMPGTILVVEDDFEILETIRDRLVQEGYTVRTATNGQEALDDLSRNQRPSLIVLDLKLPVRSGWEFLEALRKSDTLITIPVVVVSAYLGFPPAGAVAWIKKPFKAEQLLGIVKEHARPN